MYQTDNVEEFTLKFREFDKNYDVIELDNMYLFVANVLELLRDFLLNKT